MRCVGTGVVLHLFPFDSRMGADAVSLIHNERTKLLALTLNTAATSAFTVGVLAPVAAAFYDLGASRQATRVVVLGAFLWIGAAVVLHLAARRVLGWLEP